MTLRNKGEVIQLYLKKELKGKTYSFNTEIVHFIIRISCTLGKIANTTSDVLEL